MDFFSSFTQTESNLPTPKMLHYNFALINILKRDHNLTHVFTIERIEHKYLNLHLTISTLHPFTLTCFSPPVALSTPEAGRGGVTGEDGAEEETRVRPSGGWLLPQQRGRDTAGDWRGRSQRAIIKAR